MKATYEFKDGSIVPATDGRESILVYAPPDEREKQQLIETLRLDAYDLESALDPDEISRVEFAADRVSLIWKRPKSASFDQQRLRLDVASVGLFLHQDKAIVTLSEGTVTTT